MISPTVLKISPTFIMISPTVLNTPTVLKISPHGTHDSPHGTEHPHGTAHTLYRVWRSPCKVKLTVKLTVKFMKKAKNFSLPIFDLLKATKMLECWKLYSSWRTDYHTTVKNRIDNRSHKKTKKAKVIFSWQKPKVRTGQTHVALT